MDLTAEMIILGYKLNDKKLKLDDTIVLDDSKELSSYAKYMNKLKGDNNDIN